MERRAEGEVGERRRRVNDLEFADVQVKRFGRLFGGCGWLRKLFGDVREIERIIGIDLDPAIGLDRPDFFKHPGSAEKGNQLKISKRFLKRKKRLAVLVLDEQSSHRAGQDIGVDADLPDAGLAVEHL